MPDRAARVAILRRYLGGLDLRALVGEAVLHAGDGPLTTALLVALARRDGADRPAAGTYL